MEEGRRQAPRELRARERLAAWLSIGAGLIHGGIVPQHFREWWGYGLFFIFAAAAQLLFGLALLTNAVNPADFGPRWRTMKRVLYRLGVAGNLALILLYVVTRTIGTPFLGPDKGEVEPVAPIDLVDKALEIWIIVLLLSLLAASRRGREEASPA